MRRRDKIQTITLREEFDNFLISSHAFGLLQIFMQKAFGKRLVREQMFICFSEEVTKDEKT